MVDLAAMPFAPLGSSPWPRPQPPPTATLPSDAECVVVGAGITGLSAAITLAAAGRGVVIVDRSFGNGAACRSGGIVLGDTLVGPAAAFDGVEFDLREYVARHPIEGGLEWTSVLELDRDDRLPDRPIDWRDHGVVRISGRVQGGTLDPAALVERLASDAVANGGTFVNDCAIDHMEGAGRDIRLHTSRGTIDASRVLIATDATALPVPFDPWPIRKLTIVLATTPVAADVRDRMGWSGVPFYTNDLPLLWGRLLPGGGMLVGRELVDGPLSDTADLARVIAEAGERLIARARALHPAAAHLGVDRIWAGPIARNERGVPDVQRDPTLQHVLWAGGYGGHGLAQAFRLGSLAAARLLAEP